MTRARRPLHTHQAPAPAEDEDAPTRAAVAGELDELVQVCTELAARHHRELIADGDPDAAIAAAELGHELAERVRERARQWQPNI